MIHVLLDQWFAGLAFALLAAGAWRGRDASLWFRGTAIGFATLAGHAFLLVAFNLRYGTSVRMVSAVEDIVPLTETILLATAAATFLAIDDVVRQGRKAKQARLEGHESGVRWALAAEGERVTDP